MSLPDGLDRDDLLFLEHHEARVHALPARELRDLGDALLLHDPVDREPFWNRVAAIRWPTDARAFDRRLAETIALFAGIDRAPHIWPRPAFNEPPDLVARLLANGWRDTGAGMVMLLGDDSAVRDVARAAADDPAVTVERLHQASAADARRAARDLALVLAEAFEVEDGRRAAIELETLATFGRSESSACLIRVNGEPAAAVKRTTFDGASYLSSIGTRPAFRGRGLGRLATAVAASDAAAEGSRWTYLGVYAENMPAIALYRRLGFHVVGDPAPDLLLR